MERLGEEVGIGLKVVSASLVDCVSEGLADVMVTKVVGSVSIVAVRLRSPLVRGWVVVGSADVVSTEVVDRGRSVAAVGMRSESLRACMAVEFTDVVLTKAAVTSVDGLLTKGVGIGKSLTSVGMRSPSLRGWVAVGFPEIFVCWLKLVVELVEFMAWTRGVPRPKAKRRYVRMFCMLYRCLDVFVDGFLEY